MGTKNAWQTYGGGVEINMEGKKMNGFYILAHFSPFGFGESCAKTPRFAALDRHVYQSEDNVTLSKGCLWDYIQ
jgi:hypothetical protein